MKFYRIYAGDDGKSHFELLDSSKTSEFFNKTREAKGLLFRNDYSPFNSAISITRRTVAGALRSPVASTSGSETERALRLSPATYFYRRTLRGKATLQPLMIGFAHTWTYNQRLHKRVTKAI